MPSFIDEIPPAIIRLALDGAEELARYIAAKLGLTDDIATITRIKNRMLTAAFEEGVDLGIAVSELNHGAQSVLKAMEEAERDGRLRMDFPPDLIADGEGEG
jgi:hypothetical protein